MSEEFDPYLRWLGIRDRERPPNHYRLLGIELFENDPEIIAEAGDRQMGHIRTHNIGRHAIVSQRVLNEIAKAKVCLLNPAKKRVYDEQLRAQRGEATANEPPSSGEVAALPGSAAPPPMVAAPPALPAPQPPALPMMPDVASIEPPSGVETPSSMSASSAAAAAVTTTEKPPRSAEHHTENLTTPLPELADTVTVNSPSEATTPRPCRGKPTPLLVRLTVLGGPQAGSIFEYKERGVFTVGRSRQANFSIPGDQSLSRVHFSVRVMPPCCIVKNLSETTHGTQVNGRAITETVLRHGDVILGGQDSEFRVDILPLSEATADGNGAPACH